MSRPSKHDPAVRWAPAAGSAAARWWSCRSRTRRPGRASPPVGPRSRARRRPAPRRPARRRSRRGGSGSASAGRRPRAGRRRASALGAGGDTSGAAVTTPPRWSAASRGAISVCPDPAPGRAPAGGRPPGGRGRTRSICGTSVRAAPSGLRLVRAARVERAARRHVDQARRGAGDRDQPVPARSRSSRGIEPSRPQVYGCSGRRKTSSARAVLDGPPGVHHQDVVGELGDHPEVVGDDDDGRVELGLQVADQVEDLRLDRHVERRRRLVRDQQLRVAGQRHRDHRPLPHAAGELVRVVVDPRRRLRDAHPVRAARSRAGGPLPC